MPTISVHQNANPVIGNIIKLSANGARFRGGCILDLVAWPIPQIPRM